MSSTTFRSNMLAGTFGIGDFAAAAGKGAEAPGDVATDPVERDAPVPGMTCANRNSGINASAIAIASHRPPLPAPKRFKPCLKPERSPNAHLIIIETEEID